MTGKMSPPGVFSLVIGMMLLFFGQSASGAVSNEELLKRLNDLSTTIQKQQQEIEKLKQELKKHGESIDKAKDEQKEGIRDAVKAEKSWRDSLPKWTERIKISADLRLRYERIWDRGMLNDNGNEGKQEARDRGRIRARIFLDGKITDELKTHFMITTNMDSHQEATTTNATFTNDFNDKGIYLARAYADYKPNWLKGLNLGGGKFRKNFYHTDIMWDPDVNPEGVYEMYRYKGSEIFQPFVYLSQMVVNENNTAPDAMLYLNQAGFDWKIGPVKWTLAGSYYSWSNLNKSKWLHTGEYKKGGGNTFTTDRAGDILYKYEYKLWEAYMNFRFKVGPYPARICFDYIHNSADKVPSNEADAYCGYFKIGRDEKKGDCSLYYKYAYIEQNAVVGSLNDQDFYGANRKGHKVALKYHPFKYTTLRAAFFYTDPVSAWQKEGNPLWNGDRYKMHEDRLQMDCIFKF